VRGVEAVLGGGRPVHPWFVTREHIGMPGAADEDELGRERPDPWQLAQRGQGRVDGL
jgi:hypothetical protein